MTNYLNPKNYMRWSFTLANQHALGQAENLLVPNVNEPLRYPPIFFLGTPRSGSTLMTQVITDALEVGYISNRHCQWFGAPALAERLFRPTAGKPSSDYRSEQGATKGPHAPAECGQWWYRFFRRRPPYVTLHEVDPHKIQAFRRSVAALTNALDRPILFKNLYASLRIQAIAHYLPESLFIVARRDEIDNGHSLLETRYKMFNDYQHWWSMEPPQIEEIKKLPPYAQVIEQIRHIHATIDHDLEIAQVPASRRLDLRYEEFCTDPSGAIDTLRTFLASHDCVVEKQAGVPKAFRRRDTIRIEQNLYSAMVDYAQSS